MPFCKATLDLRFKSAPTISLSEIRIFEIGCFCLTVLSLVYFIIEISKIKGESSFLVCGHLQSIMKMASLSRDIAYL